MGRKRLTDKHLPQRVYLHRGSYRFKPKVGKWINLGSDLAEMFVKYGALVGAQWGGRTIGDVIDRYRSEVLPLKRSAQTQKNQAKELERLKAVFGDLRPDQLTPQHCYRYLDTRRRTKDSKPARTTARHEVVLLGHVLSKAIRWGLASTNPVRGLDFGERAGKRARVPMEQVELVRAVASERLKVAIDLAVSTGQRRGDLLTLQRSQLTDDGILFRQSKTGAEVLIEWSDDLRSIVERAKKVAPQIPGDYLIRTRRGKPYSACGFSAIWQRLMTKHVKAGGMRFSFHDLRSVSADGASTVEEAQARLGHTSSATTQRHYYHAVTRAKPRK
jgi:integrase